MFKSHFHLLAIVIHKNPQLGAWHIDIPTQTTSEIRPLLLSLWLKTSRAFGHSCRAALECIGQQLQPLYTTSSVYFPRDSSVNRVMPRSEITQMWFMSLPRNTKRKTNSNNNNGWDKNAPLQIQGRRNVRKEIISRTTGILYLVHIILIKFTCVVRLYFTRARKSKFARITTRWDSKRLGRPSFHAGRQ